MKCAILLCMAFVVSYHRAAGHIATTMTHIAEKVYELDVAAGTWYCINTNASNTFAAGGALISFSTFGGNDQRKPFFLQYPILKHVEGDPLEVKQVCMAQSDRPNVTYTDSKHNNIRRVDTEHMALFGIDSIFPTLDLKASFAELDTELTAAHILPDHFGSEKLILETSLFSTYVGVNKAK